MHTTIPKGIVGSFEFIVLQSYLKECHERSWNVYQLGSKLKELFHLCLGRDPFNQNSNRSDREKRTTSKGGPVFSKLFLLDRTDPLSFGPKFPESLVEWIAPLGARPHYSALLKRFGSRGPSTNVKMFAARSPRIRHRSELTERDWENAVQELGKDSSIQRLWPIIYNRLSLALSS